MDNGARLGWLHKPENQQVEIYRSNQDRNSNLLQLCLEGVLSGFVLELNPPCR